MIAEQTTYKLRPETGRYGDFEKGNEGLMMEADSNLEYFWSCQVRLKAIVFSLGKSSHVKYGACGLEKTPYGMFTTQSRNT